MSMIGCYIRISQPELNKLILDPSNIEELLFSEDESLNEHYFDIDKAWHGIHYLLNGKVWRGKKPLYNAVLGGTIIGEEIGYGPARYLNNTEVIELVSALNQTNVEHLKKRFNPKKFTRKKIYPDIWVDTGEDLEYLIEYFELLVDFYNKAAEKNEAVLLYLS